MTRFAFGAKCGSPARPPRDGEVVHERGEPGEPLPPGAGQEGVAFRCRERRRHNHRLGGIPTQEAAWSRWSGGHRQAELEREELRASSRTRSNQYVDYRIKEVEEGRDRALFEVDGEDARGVLEERETS